jgi:hypothetical protein
MKYVVRDRVFRKFERAFQYARRVARQEGYSEVEIEKFENREQEREFLRGKIVCRVVPHPKENGTVALKVYFFE